MNIDYIREQSGNYMAIQGEKQTDCYEMKMVECNQIDGLLSMTIRKVNNQSVYMYRISNKICMKEVCEHRLQGGKEIRAFLESLKDVLRSLREYLLRPDGLILDAEHIFMDRNSGKAYFAYYENEDGDFFAGLKHLYEECILQYVDHNDNEAVALVYGTYKRLCGNNCSIRGLFEVEEREDSAYRVVTERVTNPHVLPERESEEREESDRNKKILIYAALGVIGAVFLWSLLSALIPAMRIRGLGTFFYAVIAVAAAVGAYLLFRWYRENAGLLVKVAQKEVSLPYVKEKVRIEVPAKDRERETGPVQEELAQEEEDNDNRTVILNMEEAETTPFLRWQGKDGEHTYPIEADTVIGSSASRADCVINLPGISRMHAKILVADGKYLLKDLNSTNGTRVGEVPLSAFQLYPLQKTTTLKFGNREAEFVLPENAFPV